MKAASLAGLALALSLHAAAAAGQDVDPALADSWSFTQTNMPGVSYDLLKAACDEGALTIYAGTWTDAQANQVKHFEQRYPCIKVDVFELSTGPRRERFLAETRAGNYIVDIVQDTNVGSLNEQAEQGLLANYKISNDDEFSDAVKLSGYWYPIRMTIFVNAWNTDQVTDEEAKLLQRWDGDTNPVFKGRAGIVATSSGGVTFLPFYVFKQERGEDFIKKMAALEPRQFELSNLGTALAAGDIDVALAMSETPLTPLFEAGAPIHWAIPDDPAIGVAAGQAISAHAPHPNAARMYQEYAFTDEGYGYWQVYGGAPARRHFQDRRDFAKPGGWYKYPTDFWKYDPAVVNKALDAGFHKEYEQYFAK